MAVRQILKIRIALGSCWRARRKSPATWRGRWIRLVLCFDPDPRLDLHHSLVRNAVPKIPYPSMVPNAFKIHFLFPRKHDDFVKSRACHVVWRYCVQKMNRLASTFAAFPKSGFPMFFEQGTLISKGCLSYRSLVLFFVMGMHMSRLWLLCMRCVLRTATCESCEQCAVNIIIIPINKTTRIFGRQRANAQWFHLIPSCAQREISCSMEHIHTEHAVLSTWAQPVSTAAPGSKQKKNTVQASSWCSPPGWLDLDNCARVTWQHLCHLRHIRIVFAIVFFCNLQLCRRHWHC